MPRPYAYAHAYAGMPTPTPTVHNVAGSAGASTQDGTFTRANFSLVHANTYGYLRLDANASRLLVEFVRTNPHDGVPAGQVWDRVEIPPWH